MCYDVRLAPLTARQQVYQSVGKLMKKVVGGLRDDNVYILCVYLRVRDFGSSCVCLCENYFYFV